jgi:hypothetical protein
MSNASARLVLGVLIALPAGAHAQTPRVANAAAQIAAAILAAPEDRRAGTKVYGYDEGRRLVTLREGTNDTICLADDPAREGFEVDCYHVSLEPFMARGRELAAQGVEGPARTETRFREAEQGTLKMPDKPAMLYIVTGTSFNAATGEVAGLYRRSVIYIPYATTESTGLSTSPSTTDPWIMAPGTPGAHIMITPPRPGGDHLFQRINE